jgi:hypothetical protein
LKIKCLLALLNLAVCSVGSRTRCCISRIMLVPQRRYCFPPIFVGILAVQAVNEDNRWL